METVRKPEVIGTLKQLSAEHGGVLKPEQVVKAARSESSPLHSYFTWNDGEAAEKYRMHEARTLLSICVEYIGNPEEKNEQRVFVSLRSDRAEGGYRELVRVLGNARTRKELVADALEEMRFFQEKYKSLRALTGVFTAMKRATRRLSARKKTSKVRKETVGKMARSGTTLF